MSVHKSIWRARSALLGALAAGALFAACLGTHDRIPPPPVDSRPAEVPGAAERASLGAVDTRPSDPPHPRASAGPEMTPEGDAVSAAVNAAKARLADAGAHDSGSADASPPAPGAAESDTAGEHAVLVFSSSVAGELVPCGCSPDLRGGLPRAAGLLERWRKSEPGLVYVEAGDLLFETANAPSGPGATQLLLKARTLAQGAALLGAAARVAGARDLAAGGKFVAESAAGVPILDAGAAVPGARETLLVKAGPSGVPIGLFAAGLEPEPAQSIAARAAALRKDGARFVVLILHPSAANDGRALASAQQLLAASRAAGVDLVVLAHRDDPALDPNYAEPGSPPLVALEGHGQSLLRLDLRFPPSVAAGAPVWMPKGAEEKKADSQATDQRVQLLRERLAAAPPELKPQLEAKIAQLQLRAQTAAAAQESAPPGAVVLRTKFAALSADIPESAAAKALVAAYDKQVADENLAAAKKLPAACPRAKSGEAAFIGVSAPFAEAGKGESCASCHASEAAFWARTRHARAYETLVVKGKQFSFDCIACHTTGWQQPGGVCRIDKTEVGGPGVKAPADRTGWGAGDPVPASIALGRQGVQCEDCHGPASEHARAGGGGEILEDVPEATCRRCHDPANSPHFEMKTYRPWVVGPGHGEPLAPGESPRTRGEIAAGNKLGPIGALHLAQQAAQEKR